MGLNIKNEEAVWLAGEVARLAGESKTEAIRRSLIERRERLISVPGSVTKKGLREYLETAVWPLMPPESLGSRVTREEREEILGYGPEGF